MNLKMCHELEDKQIFKLKRLKYAADLINRILVLQEYSNKTNFYMLKFRYTNKINKLRDQIDLILKEV